MDIKALEALRAIGAKMGGDFTEAVNSTDAAKEADEKYRKALENRLRVVRERLLDALADMHPRAVVELRHPLDDMLKGLYEAADPEVYLSGLEAKARLAESDAVAARWEIRWGKGRFR